MNVNQVAKTSTADLLAFFNANTGGAQVKKFADRKTAERRVKALIEEMIADGDLQPQEETQVTEETQEAVIGEFVNCPHCGIHLGNGVCHHGQEVNGKTIKHDEFEYACLGCGGEFGTPIHRVAKSATRSEAIAKSWDNDEIAKARAARDNVSVEGYGTFRSVAAAFKKIGLPISRHIKFRIDLKANGTGTFKYGTDEYSFKVVKQEELGV